MGADSRPCCHTVIYGGNYTSALLHEHTAHFSGISSYMDEEKLGFRKKILFLKPHPDTENPLFVVTKKPISNTQSHTEPSSFLLLSVHIAGKQPLNNLTPTFITAQQCSRLFFYITARSQSALNVALHKIGSIHLTRDACNNKNVIIQTI